MATHEHSRSTGHWRGCLRALVLAAGLGLGTAHAGVVLSNFAPNPVVLPGGGWKFTAGTTFADPPPPRAWVNGVYGSVPKIVATDSLALAGRAGNLAVQVASRVTLADAALGVARCVVSSPLCFVAGLAAAAAYSDYRAKHPSQVPGSVVPEGSLDYDPGQATTPITSWQTSQFNAGAGVQTGQGTTALAACSDAASKWGKPTRNVYVDSTCHFQSYTSYWADNNLSLSTVITQGCPASIDASNPAYNVPAGGPVGPDGKCPTARYNHVAYSPEQATAKVLAYPPTDLAPKWLPAVQQSVGTGGQTIPAETVTSGPATQTGTPVSTTTTNASGTTTTTTTPTYAYTYAGDTITYVTTNTTQTCVGASACTSGSATTTVTSGAPQAAPQDPTDPCTANPGRVGCVDLGSAPGDQVPKSTASVPNYSPESVALPVGCPSPVAISGRSYSYQPICDAATAARPWVLVGAAFSALMLVVAALRAM